MEPRVRHARRHSRPPLFAPPPRAPRPRASSWPPPAGTAPPPAPLYGQSSPGLVRQWRPRPSPCVTERLRGGSGSPGEPQCRRLRKLGECARRTVERTRDQTGSLVPATGSRSRPGRYPAGSVRLFLGTVHERGVRAGGKGVFELAYEEGCVGCIFGIKG